ncbi:MAG: alpha/beta hydrolase [Patescibacteria group bacterium]|jgi:pimeloyl-ACP methyl ester carboxylesterase
MEKIFIKNRHGLKMVVQIEKPESPSGLAFVMHGRGGFKEQPYIRAFAQGFLDNNYVVISFDTTNSLGESDGDYGDATVTNYYEDLEDVISWAAEQSWYQKSFILCGHSLGGMCVALYAEKFPDEVKALVLFSSAVSGQLSLESFEPEELANWEKTGWRTSIGYSSGLVKKLKWSHTIDLQKYTLLDKVVNLTMPVILMVGELDEVHPLAHQEILFKALPGPKELHIIKGAAHTLKEPEHIQEVYQMINNWLKTLK